MNEVLPMVLIMGALILVGSILVLVKRSRNVDESHVRVGKEWMTVVEYKRRSSLKAK